MNGSGLHREGFGTRYSLSRTSASKSASSARPRWNPRSTMSATPCRCLRDQLRSRRPAAPEDHVLLEPGAARVATASSPMIATWRRSRPGLWWRA